MSARSTPLRELCRVMAEALGLPTVIPYAAKLVRKGWLPRGDLPITRTDAAVLLAGVLGSSAPRQADAAVSVASITFLSTVNESGVAGGQMYKRACSVDTWSGVLTVVDLLAEALTADHVRLDVVCIQESGNGAWAQISGTAPENSHLIYDFAYAATRPNRGMVRSNAVSWPALLPLREALRQPDPTNAIAIIEHAGRAHNVKPGGVGAGSQSVH